MKQKNWLPALIVAVALGFMACGEADDGGGSTGAGPLSASDVGLQLYSVRGLVNSNRTGDYEYIKNLLAAVKNVGYQNVEPYDYWGLSPDEWKSILEEVGLKVTGLHHGIPGNGIQGGSPTPTQVMKDDVVTLKTYLDAFGLDYSIINYAGWTTEAQWDMFYDSLKRYVGVLHDEGIKVGFHSHNHEYAEFRPDVGPITELPERVYDKIVETVDIVEIDLHWAMRGGIDPVDAIKEYTNPNGRYNGARTKLQYLHMKDISIAAHSGNYVPTRFEEIGDGTIDWPEVIKAGKEQGIKYYVVEQDGNYWDNTLSADAGMGPIDFSQAGQLKSIRRSFDYLRQFFNSSYRYPVKPNLEGTSNQIKRDQLSVQLYTVFSAIFPHWGDKAGIRDNILKPIADIGYKNVELFHPSGLSGADRKEILTETGLNPSSMHQNLPNGIAFDPSTDTAALAEMVTFLHDLGLNHIFVAFGDFASFDGYLDGEPTYDASGVQTGSISDGGARKFLGVLNDFRNALRNANAETAAWNPYVTQNPNGGYTNSFPITVNYHNHTQEFAQGDNSRTTFWDLLINAGYKVELDTHWAVRGAQNPVNLILKHSKAIICLHIKDLAFAFSNAPSNQPGSPNYAIPSLGMNFRYEEIGDGVLNWDQIFRASNKIGIQYYVVEQDANYIDGSTDYGNTSGDPFKSLKRSYDYIKANFGGEGF
jgi:sugar phosphate isomerase/epimerase